MGPHCSNASSGNSSASGMDKQVCGMYNFYCPRTNQCFDRKERCTGKVCLDANGEEQGCSKNANDTYNFYLKKSSLKPQKWSSKNITLYELNHWFVCYRGFVYEFGKTYGLQELDVSDPNHKYGPNGNKKVIYKKCLGSSNCTREQIQQFNKKWLQVNKGYKLFSNNCQDYAKALLKNLENNCDMNLIGNFTAHQCFNSSFLG